MATILIVDANPTDRRAYITLLGNYGHRLLEAAHVAEALEVAHAELPDLIIADILTPNADGFAIMQRLRDEPLLAGIPVLFHTSNYDETEIHRLAHVNGVQHILRKPAEPQDILRAVNESLEQSSMASRIPPVEQLQREHQQLLVDKLYQKILELEKANERLRTHSLIDGMTGLNNRRGFMILATGLLKFARRAGVSSCLIYIDLDSLKHINNVFGHTGGDRALTQFSNILTETFRESDVIGRLGGDEFVILLIDASEEDLAAMQARLQRGVDAYNQQVESGFALSFSMGGIRVDAKSRITMEALLSKADEAMFKHKQTRKQSS